MKDTLYTWGIVLIAVIVFSFFQSARADDEFYYWPTTPLVTYDENLDKDFINVIKYSTWAVSERLNLNLRSEPGGMLPDRIHVREALAGELPDSVAGRARIWGDNDSRTISRVEILMKPKYAVGSFCGARVMTHELFHAIGSLGHSEDRYDVMYKSLYYCVFDRYTLTAGDLNRVDSRYEVDRCYAELTPTNILSIPNIAGVQAELIGPGDEWKLGVLVDSHSSCSGEFDGENGYLPDVRSMDANYSIKLRVDGNIATPVEVIYKPRQTFQEREISIEPQYNDDDEVLLHEEDEYWW